MSKEMKKILSRFLFGSTVLTCLLCLMAGTVTASQRSQYNSRFTPYAVLSVKNTSSSIDVRVDEKSYSFDFSSLGQLYKYRDYLYYTPFSAVAFFSESLFDLIEALNE